MPVKWLFLCALYKSFVLSCTEHQAWCDVSPKLSSVGTCHDVFMFSFSVNCQLCLFSYLSNVHRMLACLHSKVGVDMIYNVVCTVSIVGVLYLFVCYFCYVMKLRGGSGWLVAKLVSVVGVWLAGSCHVVALQWFNWSIPPQEKEVQDLKAEISKLRIENRKQAKELNTLSKVRELLFKKVFSSKS